MSLKNDLSICNDRTLATRRTIKNADLRTKWKFLTILRNCTGYKDKFHVFFSFHIS